jgi:putative ABC transport system permease protein
MLSRIKTALRALLRKPQAERELDEELRHHIEQQTEQNIRLGMSPEEARQAALKSFGGMEQAKERSRDARGVTWLEELWQDLRYGARMLVKRPGFTLIVVLTLALGVGANTAIFSVVNAVLLRPLPYEASERLIYVFDSNPTSGFPRFASSPPNFADWRQQQQSFEYLAAFLSWSFNLTGRGEPERIAGARVSAEIFPLLGVKPLLGRTFLPDEDRAGNNRVVLLSQALWQRHFAEDRNVIGQALTLNSESYTIIGVIPSYFRVPSQSELWIPGGFDEFNRRGNHFLGVLGRLKSGVSLRQAQTDLETIARRLEQQYPDTNKGWGVELVPLFEVVVGDIQLALWVMLAAVGCVLLIACVNVANLLLSRAATRRREMVIRSALGASRWRIVRQLLAESMLLALIGGGVGFLLGLWSVELLTSFGADRIPRVEEIGMDQRVLVFTLLITLLTGFLFGLAPALQNSKPELSEALKEGGKGGGTGWRGKRARSLLVVAQIALSLVLLVGAGLLLKSFLRLHQVKLGFQPEHVLTAMISLPRERYAEARQRNGFYQKLLQQLSAVPGVQSAGVVDPLPLVGDSNWEFFIEGGPRLPDGRGYNTNFRRCSPDYFRTLSIPLLQGRLFTELDTAEAEQVLIINQTFQQRFFPNGDALGKRIAFRGPDGPWHTIVGVVGDVRHVGLEREAGLELYRPFAQTPAGTVTLAVKSALEPGVVAASIRREVSKLDAAQPIYSIIPMSELIARDIAPERFNLLLLAVFAAVALLLAAIGIYGVMNYAVTERARELGIRLALGAQPRDVLRLVFGQAVWLVVAGGASGLGMALALTRLMRQMLFEVGANDPMTFTFVALLLALVALLACWIPARRAMKVDPLVALRNE